MCRIRLASAKMSKDEIESDLFRDTPVRYLGYTNEVGESFRAHIHVNWVRLSYAFASSYVVADALSKGRKAYKMPWPDDTIQRSKVFNSVIDTLIWQGLASVAIPGFTINRICATTNFFLKRFSGLPPPVRKFSTTIIGLCCIPLIIKPIDHSVDRFMEATFRKYYDINEVVKHSRND